MVKHLNAPRLAHSRLLLPVLAVLVLFLTSACGLFGAKKKISVPQLLTPATEAGTDRLIQEVNRLSTVTSIHGKVDIRLDRKSTRLNSSHSQISYAVFCLKKKKKQKKQKKI